MALAIVGDPFVTVLVTRAVLFRVYIKAADFQKIFRGSGLLLWFEGTFLN